MDYTVAATAVIPAPLGAVFDRLTDIERLPAWNREIRRIVERPDRVVEGAEWVVEIRAMKTRWNSRTRATAVDREAGRFTYRSQSDDGNPSFADWCWELVEVADGTLVTVSVGVNPRTFWRKALLARLRRRGLAKAMRRSLDALAADLRADAGSGQAPAPS